MSRSTPRAQAHAIAPCRYGAPKPKEAEAPFFPALIELTQIEHVRGDLMPREHDAGRHQQKVEGH
jgi:hypothetical protein